MLLVISQAFLAAVVTVIPIAWNHDGLTAAQRAWVEAFARDAASITAPTGPAAAQIETMRRHAGEARKAGLPFVAAYLEQISEGDATAAENAFKATEHEPVIVLVRLQKPGSAGAFSDVIVGVRDRNDLWLDAFEHHLDEFARTLPGYSPSWQKSASPRGVSYLGNLVFRAGVSAQSTSPASYPPFDAALRPVVGRSWIHWRNMMAANWFEREIRPTAEAALDGSVTRLMSGDGQVRWYALRYVTSNIGPEIVGGRTLKEALGDAWDPIVIAKSDVTAILADQWLGRAPLRNDLATLLAVTFHTLNDVVRGSAPQQHRPATCLTLNWCLRHGGLEARDGGWRIHDRAMLRSLQSLTRELLEIETAGDRARALRLLSEYGTVTPPIQAALDRLPPPSAPPPTIRYAILGEP
jgi:hypothetical protein